MQKYPMQFVNFDHHVACAVGVLSYIQSTGLTREFDPEIVLSGEKARGRGGGSGLRPDCDEQGCQHLCLWSPWLSRAGNGPPTARLGPQQYSGAHQARAGSQ